MTTLDLIITKGDTFERTLRWETQPKLWKPITAITQSAPCRVTSEAHGLTNGWRGAIVSVKGMTQINASSNPPKDSDYYTFTVVNADTLEINDLNSTDFSAYASGGYILVNTPVELTGFTANMEIRDKSTGTLIIALDETSGITINNTNKTIVISLTAAQTDVITNTKGIYDLEMTSADGKVTKILSGKVKFEAQVTQVL